MTDWRTAIRLDNPRRRRFLFFDRPFGALVDLSGPGLYGVLATSDDWSDLDLIVRSRYGLLGNDMEVDGLTTI